MLRHDDDRSVRGRRSRSYSTNLGASAAGVRLVDACSRRRQPWRAIVDQVGVPGSGRSGDRDADSRLPPKAPPPSRSRDAATVSQAPTPQSVTETEQQTWQLQIGCVFYCVDTQQVQQAQQSITIINVQARRDRLESRRRRRDRSDHLAGAGRLRRLVLRRDPGAGRHRAEHGDTSTTSPRTCGSTSRQPPITARARPYRAGSADGDRSPGNRPRPGSASRHRCQGRREPKRIAARGAFGCSSAGCLCGCQPCPA